VRIIVSMSNCSNNSQTVRCICIDCIVMDLPVDKVDNPFSASRCCNYLLPTLIVCIESTEDSLCQCGVITLVYQFSVIVYYVGLVTISVIGSCLCRGLAHFFKNSPSFVTCLVSQLIFMDVTEASNSTLPNSNVPVLSIMSITSALIIGCVLVAGVTRMGLRRYRQFQQSYFGSVQANSSIDGNSIGDAMSISGMNIFTLGATRMCASMRYVVRTVTYCSTLQGRARVWSRLHVYMYHICTYHICTRHMCACHMCTEFSERELYDIHCNY